jgi:hypothetical protein
LFKIIVKHYKKFQILYDERTKSIAYEAYSRLIPILHGRQFLPRTASPQHIQLYCGTKQILKRLVQAKSPLQTPNQTYSPDWDLTHAISISTTTFHRTSYLATTDKPQYMVPKHRLLKLIHTYQTSEEWTTSTSYYSVAQLQINNSHVPADYTHALRKQHTSPPIDTYFITKYSWERHTIANIAWTAHAKALTTLPQRMNKTITQFIHNW